TFWLANPAIDTFVRMDDQHVLALVETIHGADFYTIHQLTFDATLIDYIGHLSFLPDGQASQWRTRTTAFAGCAINIPMAVFLYRARSSVTCAMPLRLAGSAVGPRHTAVRGLRVRARRSRC